MLRISAFPWGNSRVSSGREKVLCSAFKARRRKRPGSWSPRSRGRCWWLAPTTMRPGSNQRRPGCWQESRPRSRPPGGDELCAARPARLVTSCDQVGAAGFEPATLPCEGELRQRELTFSPAGNQRSPTLRGLRTKEAAMERSNGGVRKLLRLAGLASWVLCVLPATAAAPGPAGFEACA